MKIKKQILENYTVLTETTLNRVVKGHDKDGYIMILACRNDALENPRNEEELIAANNIRTRNLLTDIQRSRYSYIRVYGGYKEEGSDRASVEKSFIVFPYDLKNKTKIDYDEFLEDMISLGRKYNQDSILVKKPYSDPQYFDCRTLEYVGPIFKNVTLNDIQKEYFTALKKWSDISKKGNSIEWKGKPQRFTYEESYLDNPPYNNMNRHMRYSLGELF